MFYSNSSGEVANGALLKLPLQMGLYDCLGFFIMYMKFSVIGTCQGRGNSLNKGSEVGKGRQRNAKRSGSWHFLQLAHL